MIRKRGQISQVQCLLPASASSKDKKRKLEKGPKRYLHTHVHGSIIHDNQEVEATHVSIMDEWISKMWSSHMMEYYPVLKRKAILTCATTLMSPKDIVLLSEIGQSQKDKYCVTPLLGGVQSSQNYTGRKSRTEVARGW